MNRFIKILGSFVFAFVLTVVFVPTVKVSAQTIEVTGTLQTAVDAASPGDTINISPGAIFDERVVINKANLTINGNGATVRYSMNLSAASAVTDNANAIKVDSAASGLVINNLQIENTHNPDGSPNDEAQAVGVFADNCRFNNVTFRSYVNTLRLSGSAVFNGCAIYGTKYTISGNGQAFFKNCTIETRDKSIIPGDPVIISPMVEANFVFSGCVFQNQVGVSGTVLVQYFSVNAYVSVINSSLAELNTTPIIGSGAAGGQPTTKIKEYGNTGAGADPSRPQFSQEAARAAEAAIIADLGSAASGLSPSVPMPVPVIPEPVPEPEPEPTPQYTYAPEYTRDLSPNTVTLSSYVSKFGSAFLKDKIYVTAGVNKNGFIDSESTANAVYDAKINAIKSGSDTIYLAIPQTAKAMSASAARKIRAFAGNMNLLVSFSLTANGKNIGNITFPLTKATGNVIFSVNLNSKNTADFAGFITKNYGGKMPVLGGFELSQKSVFGGTAEITINAESLGIVPEADALYFGLMRGEDGEVFRVPVEVSDGQFIIKTSRSGLILICYGGSGEVPATS